MARLAPLSASIVVDRNQARRGLLRYFGLLLPLSALLEGLIIQTHEIGWRGYMLTRLIDAEVPQPILVSGLIWGLWHVPVIPAGMYAAGPLPLLSAALFTGSLISVGYVLARLRLATGSVWPAIALHGAWNSVIQGPFDHATAGARRLLWTGESGILVVLTLLLATIMVARWPAPMLRQLPRRDVRRVTVSR
jgi:membrane protease YdiL (CAAX protease family)